MILLSLTIAMGATQADPKSGRHLVLSEDYAHMRQIDSNVWKFNDGPVYNNEKEKYTNEAGHNAWIQDKQLVIEARKDGNTITSARMETFKAWTHPYVEVVAKVPQGRGTWPAIWMLNDRLRHKGTEAAVGWPQCGEVDIMENVGYDPPGFHFSLHCGKYNWTKPQQRTKVLQVSDPQHFHKFAVDMRPDRIVFYCDGKPAYTVDNAEHTFDAWPFDDSYYLILNLAIGGNWGGQKGIDDSIFPSRYYVKSVKIWD